MPHRFVRPAPQRERRLEGTLTFHAQTELDDDVARALLVDLEARIRRYGWQPDLNVRVEHAVAAVA